MKSTPYGSGQFKPIVATQASGRASSRGEAFIDTPLDPMDSEACVPCLFHEQPVRSLADRSEVAMRHIMAVLAIIASVARPAAAADSIPQAAALSPPTHPQVKQGCDLVLENQVAHGTAILRPLVESSPTDTTARACYATALSLSGSYEQARQQVSVVLSWNPQWVDGYVVRAVSAAEMGATRQAKHDLELARQLDPKDGIKAIGLATQRIDKALAEAPKEHASRLHTNLLKGARDGLSMDELVERSRTLLNASNAERRLGDET
jgi:hypothetical protein